MEKKIKEVTNVKFYDERYLYDPKKDSGKVIPDLGVSIDDMLQTGVVKDSGETLDNNGIDDVNQIIGRIRDSFDALDAARAIKKYGKRNPAKVNSEVQNLSNNSSNEPN